MNFRYTIKELENKSDMWLILRLITERKSKCSNINSPLYLRLKRLENKIYKKEKLTDKLIKGQWNEVQE